MGGAAADTFILGDISQAYYQGNAAQDYALIKDFTVGSDRIQLYGSVSGLQSVSNR